MWLVATIGLRILLHMLCGAAAVLAVVLVALVTAPDDHWIAGLSSEEAAGSVVLLMAAGAIMGLVVLALRDDAG